MARFGRDESGAMILFVIVLFVLLAVVAGMGLDLIRHESARADLQNALDRGVLAATNLRGEVADKSAAEAIVGEYLATRRHAEDGATLDIAMPTTASGRAVQARADSGVNTIFLPAMGVDRLTVPAYAGAAQGAERTEIALVVDVSYSMTYNSTYKPGNTKLDDLKEAASAFIDAVLTADTAERTLISIIPYSAQVNPGSLFLDGMTFAREHDYGSCFEYTSMDFSALGLDPTATYKQHRHFIEAKPSGKPTVYSCPTSNNEIMAYSNDPVKLKQKINSLTSEYWTSTYMGMRWASVVLDPSSAGYVDSRIAAATNPLPALFNDYPLPYESPLARKVVVLMTDGRNTKLHSISDSAWAAKGPEHFNTHSPSSSEKTVIVNNDNSVTRSWMGDDGVFVTETDQEGDWALRDACSAFKNRYAGNLLYTIGFELSNNAEGLDAAKALSDCASSAATTFIVNGLAIESAFQAIVADLDKLRLTQ